jgi:hypothetical protein
MAYFARDSNRSPPRKQGLRTGGAVQVPPPKEVVTRDNYIDQSIASMQPKDPNNGGVLRFIGDSEGQKRHGRNVNYKPDNDIFGPPITAPKRTPRVRLGVSDEDLAKIWQEDDRKAAAQQSMQNGTNLVHKMVAEPINPVIAHERSKDAVPPPRKVVHLFTQTTEHRNLQANQPQGFSGMGAQCKSTGRGGVQCKPAEEFLAPELVPRKRNEGRRTKFPKDTFSFQDDNQTHYD